MTAGDRLHAAGFNRRIGQRDPGGYLDRRFEAEIGGVLVPADKGRVMRVLCPNRQMEEADVGADQILDGIDDRRVMDDLVDPAEQQMRLEVVALAEFLALLSLECFETVAATARLGRSEHIDWKQQPVALVASDLGL
jgi:hypothetical protein